MSDVDAEIKEDMADPQRSGRIEGGIDAIVIGAGVDGLAAAAYLGKAGLHTVLAGAGQDIGGRIKERELAPGVVGVDGEHLVTILDPDVIAELDLYRHGLSFAARRLETTCFFENGEPFKSDGDLARLQVAIDDAGDREAVESFMMEMLDLSAFLRPAFRAAAHGPGGDADRVLKKAIAGATAQRAGQIQRYLFASVDDVLSERFEDGPLKTFLYAEAAFRSGTAPNEPFSFMSYLRRLAGEAAGLQGAKAYPAGGALSVVTALRRAAQQAKVDIRVSAPVKSILIEGDRIAGVTLEDGGQLRAPIVIAAAGAERVFLNMIGVDKIDIELQRVLTMRRRRIATARVQLVLKGVAQDDVTKSNMRRRLFFAPAPEMVRAAFLAARAGKTPEHLVIEALFPGALDESAVHEGRQLMSVMAHPVPFDETPPETRRDEIKEAALKCIDMFATGLSDRIETVDVQLPCDEAAAAGTAAATFAAKPEMIRQWAFASAVTRAAGIAGFYFCGPEAQTGEGISCASARIAARAALRAYHKGIG
ncbi:phytoene desaturase family protein [Hyphococcus sp.]|uniref:phytoene desaturase family protein n=1 Tax=Hyphococcus sp. TaxID=2038636 RepID=UPI003CCB9EE2